MPSDWKQPEEITEYLEWVAEKGAEPTTLRIYRGRLNHLSWWLQECNGVGLLQATTDDLRAWRASLRYSRRTVILYMGVAKAFYAWAHRRQKVDQDPAWLIPTPRYRRSVPRPIGTSTLIVAIEGAPAMIRVWLILAAFCGLRAMEIAGLRREDLIDDADAPYMLVQGKGGKERSVPLSTRVWAELQLYGLPARGEIFRRKDGLPFTPGHLDTLANEYLHDMGIKETLHQLRHWFGTQGHKVTDDLLVVGETMGHSSLNVTRGYSAIDPPKARAMVEAIQLDPWPARLGDYSSDPRT